MHEFDLNIPNIALTVYPFKEFIPFVFVVIEGISHRFSKQIHGNGKPIHRLRDHGIKK